ncbi:DUF5336 domain-containing protein [Mycobacterium kyorinense]|uniref:34 kDa antigenic protein n=1 Tax=Mycobacterium kyorinense TaxID=487514 RepID=A0A1X1XVV3_9MYCO|nr:DUF5336 domain-containing protein [Mycobacterium kyorinense]ORW02919.1 hypothetical protein AWC14_05670 [Mycobacterium kyorinense]
MTYSPGSPGYPPAQSQGSYGASTPSFAKSEEGASNLGLYLTIAVVALGLASYLASFGPMYTVSSDVGPVGDITGGDVGIGVIGALLAGLLAAVGLLPKAKNYSAVVAAIAVFGLLTVIKEALGKPSGFSIGWALWIVLACAVLQASAAVAALLLDAGVITPPAPRPKYDQFGHYGQYGGQPGGYYGQQGPYQQHSPQPSPQHSGYGSQYGGYPSSPSTGGFSTVGQQTGPQQQASQSGPQQGGQQGSQQGPPTPPTGFPSFGQPQSGGSGSQGAGQGNSANHGGQAQPSYGQGQQPQSPSSGQSQS